MTEKVWVNQQLKTRLTKTEAFLTKRVKDENYSKQALAMEYTLTDEKYTS